MENIHNWIHMDKDDAVEYFLSVRSRELDKMIARDAELVYYRQHTPNLELEIRNLVQKVKGYERAAERRLEDENAVVRSNSNAFSYDTDYGHVHGEVFTAHGRSATIKRKSEDDGEGNKKKDDN